MNGSVRVEAPRRLLLATHNPGKLREFRELLAGLGYEIVRLTDLGVTVEAPETGATFAENAAQKAQFYANLTGLPTIADDSGIVVDALGGEPGIHSARYGGPGLDDRGRVDLLLTRLRGTAPDQRACRFIAVIAFVDGDSVELFEGRVEGRVADAPAGDHGFGYDPVFYLAEYRQTLAQIDPAVKNQISHRARAAAALRARLTRLDG